MIYSCPTIGYIYEREKTGNPLRLLSSTTALAALSTALIASCGAETASNAASEPMLSSLAPSDWAITADFTNRGGEKVGAMALTQGPHGALIRVDMSGLKRGWHGMHFHEIGDCSDGADGFKAAKGHFNPNMKAHGFLNPDGPELANLTNIYAGVDGRATAEFFAPNVVISSDDGEPALIDADGFAVIIHENIDDHATQPIGGSGGRVACAAVNK